MAVDADKASNLGSLVVRVWDMVVYLLVNCWLGLLLVMLVCSGVEQGCFLSFVGIFVALREQIRGNHSNFRACGPRRSAE